MIVVNHQLQAIGCDICEEFMELRRNITEAPELLAMVREHWQREHAPCEEYKDKPHLAKPARKFCAGMREAFNKPQSRPQHTVRPVFARCRRPR